MHHMEKSIAKLYGMLKNAEKNIQRQSNAYGSERGRREKKRKRQRK